MSIERLLALIPLAVLIVLLVWMLPQAVRVWQTYAGTGQRRQEDVTGRAPEPGYDTPDRIAALEAVGFRLIGATRVIMPLGQQYARIMVADDGESYAIVADATSPRAGVSALYSAWPDGTWIGTMNPEGDPHIQPGLELTVVPGPLAEAAVAHRSRLEGSRQAHGRPRRIERMADVLELDAAYRARFGGRELRPLVIRKLLPTGIVLGTAVVYLYLLVTGGSGP